MDSILIYCMWTIILLYITLQNMYIVIGLLVDRPCSDLLLLEQSFVPTEQRKITGKCRSTKKTVDNLGIQIAMKK